MDPKNIPPIFMQYMRKQKADIEAQAKKPN